MLSSPLDSWRTEAQRERCTWPKQELLRTFGNEAQPRLDQQAYSPACCSSGVAQNLGGFPATSLDVPAVAELLPVLGHESGWAEKSPGSCDWRSTCCLGWAMVKEVLHGPCSHSAEPVVDIRTFQRHVLKALRSIYFGCKN